MYIIWAVAKELDLRTVTSWTEADFDVIQAVEDTQGPVIEIGGPTSYRREFLRLAGLDLFTIGLPVYGPKKTEIFISNIRPGYIDFQADGRVLPFRNESIGAIYATSLPSHIIPDIIMEAHRVLEEGGIFILQRVGDIGLIVTASGFKLREVERIYTKFNDGSWGNSWVLVSSKS